MFLVCNNLYITIPGTTPLVTTSAKESNCFPNSPEIIVLQNHQKNQKIFLKKPNRQQ